MTGRPLLALSVLVGIVCALKGGFIDLAVYQYGARAALDGVPLYAARDGLPFTYPPFAALVLVVATLSPFALAVGAWSAASVLVLGRTVSWFTDLSDWHVAGLTAAALALEPLWTTLSFGQVNLFLMAAISFDLLRIDRRYAGWLVGLAAGIKLTPLLFVVFLFLVGRCRAGTTALASFGATVVLGFIVLPRDSVSYWKSVLWDPDRVGGVAFASNQSVLGAMTRLLGHQPSTQVWFVVAGLVTSLVLLVAAAEWRRGSRPLAICVAGLAMLVASPISWSHHWVWAAPLAFVLWERSRTVAVAWSAVFVSAVIWWPPHRDDRELVWNAGQQLLGNAYLLGAVVVCAWLAFSRAGSLRRPSAVPPRTRASGGQRTPRVS